MRIKIISLIVVVLITIMGILYFCLNKENHENSSEPLTYVLKKYNNTIAIFIEGEDFPFEILDVPYNNLPFSDKELLNKGIRSKSLEEIMKHAEDYDG